MNPDSARYQLTEDDYLRAGALCARMSVRTRLVIGLIALALVAVALAGPAGPRAAAVGGLIGGVVALALIRGALSPWMLRRHYRRYKAIQDEQAIMLTDDGLQFTSINGDTRLRWDRILKWRKGEAYFLIFVMPRMYFIVPLRVAEQGFDVAGLEAALLRHVGPPQ